jgi:hypothetical protein
MGVPTVALTITEQRYQEIRASVKRKKLAAEIEEIMAEPGSVPFKNIDEFLAHLDEQTVDRPARSRQKRP